MPPSVRAKYIQTVAPHLLFMNPHPPPTLLADLPHLQKLELREQIAETYVWPILTNLTHLNLTLAHLPLATAFGKLREALNAMPCLATLRVELCAVENADYHFWESFLGEAQRRNMQEITYVARQKNCIKIKLQWHAWRTRFEWLRLRFEEASP